MKRILGLFLLCLSILPDVNGQGLSKFQIWTDFDPSYKFSDKWSVGGDIGYRIAPPDNRHTAYVRPNIKYKFNSTFNFNVGIASFNSWDEGKYTKSEFRTFQFIGIAWPKVGGFIFNHRLGLEQRWFYLPSINLNTYISRSRYYLELISPNFHLFGLKPPFFMMTNFEILRDLNQNEFGRLADHNRYTIGIGNHVSDNFRAEVRFKIINVVDPLINSFISEISVIRIRLYYRFAST